MTDGSEGPPLRLRSLFERFVAEMDDVAVVANHKAGEGEALRPGRSDNVPLIQILKGRPESPVEEVGETV